MFLQTHLFFFSESSTCSCFWCSSFLNMSYTYVYIYLIFGKPSGNLTMEKWAMYCIDDLPVKMVLVHSYSRGTITTRPLIQRDQWEKIHDFFVRDQGLIQPEKSHDIIIFPVTQELPHFKGQTHIIVHPPKKFTSNRYVLRSGCVRQSRC